MVTWHWFNDSAFLPWCPLSSQSDCSNWHFIGSGSLNNPKREWKLYTIVYTQLSARQYSKYDIKNLSQLTHSFWFRTMLVPSAFLIITFTSFSTLLLITLYQYMPQEMVVEILVHFTVQLFGFISKYKMVEVQM